MDSYFSMKKLKIILLLGFIQFLFLLPIIGEPFYQSHDGPLHLARFAAYISAIKDNHIPPRWAGSLNYGYGTPVLDLFAPLAGYLATGLYFFGINLATVFKIIIGAAFIAAPISFYLWSNSFTASLLYGLSPYVFLDVFVRGDIGEMLAFVFIPLVLVSMDAIKYQSLQHVLSGVIGLTLLILSHNGMSLLFVPIFVVYGFLTVPKRKFPSLALMLAGALGLSAFFWIPALVDQKYINPQLFSSMYREHFIQLTSLITKPWGFGTDINKPGGLSPQIGILRFILVVVAMASAFRSKIKDKIFFFWATIFFISIFLATPKSQFLWQTIPLIQKLQFPWRFMAISTFSGAALIALLLQKIRNRWIFALVIVLTLLTSISMASIQKSITVADVSAFKHEGTTALHGEATTIWTAGDPSSTPTEPIQIIEGDGSIKAYIKKNSLHTFTAQANQNIKILDNTLYFPGWKVYADGQKIPIEFQDLNHRGLITFPLPAGNHAVQVLFTETRLRQLANAISLFSLGFVIVLLL
ncbi:MAG: hypothetical protein AAB889_01700 [Patescibacteria group bacterium]